MDVCGGGCGVAKGHNRGEGVRAEDATGLARLTGSGHGMVEIVEHGSGTCKKDREIGHLTLELLAVGREDLLRAGSSEISDLRALRVVSRASLRVRQRRALLGKRHGRKLSGRRGSGRGGGWVEESRDTMRIMRSACGDVGRGLRRYGGDWALVWSSIVVD